MNASSSIKTPRRRRRGEQRIESLLAAAERVFAEVGYEEATTNLIAARAGASPGTLYQFFKNKEQIAEAIAARYARQLELLLQEVLDPLQHSSWEEALDSFIGAHLNYLDAAPAYRALLGSAGISPHVSELHSLLVDSAVTRTYRVIARFAPRLTKSDVMLHAVICENVVRGTIPMLQASNPRRRKRAAEEVKQVIKRYLAPIMDASSAGKTR